MRYTVIVPKRVQKEINRIDKRYQAKIKTALVLLSGDPLLGKRLEGERKNEWSFRVWPYRIIYQIENKKMIILIIKVGHRQGVYS